MAGIFFFFFFRELPFQKGDIVYIIRQVDQNWYEGEHHGRVGIFPRSYVEVGSFGFTLFLVGSDKLLYNKSVCRCKIQVEHIIPQFIRVHFMCFFLNPK